jgi:hypothetical protein
VGLARLLAVAFLAYFSSGERVIAQLAAARAGQPALHVETAVASSQSGAPARLAFDLHPDFGLRAADDRGRRWLVQRGRVVAGSEVPPPAWLPDLELLVLRDEGALHAWLTAHGVDAAANELARCGDGDCYVLGSRQGRAQLWVEKKALEVRRMVVPEQAALELQAWRAFEKLRFPGEVVLAGGAGPIATFTVESVVAAPALGSGDFSPSWVQAAPPPPE